MSAGEVRISALDGLRGLAILLVLIHHGVYFFPTSGSEEVFMRLVGGWSAWGWIGVDLFFVLSGYLITNILLNTWQSPKYFRTFFARRTLRIFPLYYLSLFLFFYIMPFLGYDITHVPPGERIWFWTYTLNFFYGIQNHIPLWMCHFWSLCVEEHFYLFWPVVVWLFGGRIKYICISIIIAVTALRFGLCISGVKPLAIYTMTVTRIDTLAMGALIAALQHSGGGLASLRPYCRWLAPLMGGYIFLLTLLTGGLNPLSQTVLLWGLPAVALFWACCLLLIVSAHPERFEVRLLSHPILKSLGTYSYGLYVFHLPILGVVHHWLGTANNLQITMLPTFFGSQIPMVVTQSAIMILLTCIMAVTCFHLYEKSFLLLKRYFV
ncbi:acyltransferase [soil metagenome]